MRLLAETYKEIHKKRAKKAKAMISKRNGGPLMKLLIFSASLCFIIYCGFTIIVTGSENAEKRIELEKLNSQISELNLEKDELNGILNECDQNAYMEKIAMDILGYAYPNERRFYDTRIN